jgi:hypothetical protein
MEGCEHGFAFLSPIILVGIIYKRWFYINYAFFENKIKLVNLYFQLLQQKNLGGLFVKTKLIE